ncbi:hypothetical protein A4A49_53201 [Nicotiana attenuata]|uniref:F-box protein n=1 Tax=Nicotiana attenuata TaxID=49451 RepID=A0A1J6IDF5_NICAT|nr:hypothetical protein A4A49_53201 [Nicotiana attenuata]
MIVVPIKSEKENASILDIGGRLCLMTVRRCRNRNVLFKGYVAYTNDLGSLNSWKLEFSVTAPELYDIDDMYYMSFTNEMLMVEENDRMMGFFDVAKGRLLGEMICLLSTFLIPYVPSLVALHHRPKIREKIYLDVVCGL